MWLGLISGEKDRLEDGGELGGGLWGGDGYDGGDGFGDGFDAIGGVFEGWGSGGVGGGGLLAGGDGPASNVDGLTPDSGGIGYYPGYDDDDTLSDIPGWTEGDNPDDILGYGPGNGPPGYPGYYPGYGGGPSDTFGSGFSGGSGYEGTFDGSGDGGGPTYAGDFGESDSGIDGVDGIDGTGVDSGGGTPRPGGYGDDSRTIGDGLSSERVSTETGDGAAGIRVFEQAGVTYDGYRVQAGAVEVFGNEVHFSNTGSSKQRPRPPDPRGPGSPDDGSGVGFNAGELIGIGNLRASGDNITVGESVDITVDIANSGNYTEKVGVTLFASDDGSEKDTLVVVGPGGETSHTFTVSREYPGNVRFDVADESVFVNWVVSEDTDQGYNSSTRLKGGVGSVKEA